MKADEPSTTTSGKEDEPSTSGGVQEVEPSSSPTVPTELSISGHVLQTPIEFESESNGDLLRRIKEVGHHILDKYCYRRPNEPTILPPIPNISKFIDKFPEEGLSIENESDRRQQEAYEARVMVYRALERLQENIVVLHGLSYTNRQYGLFNPHFKYDAEKPNKGVGECDFLVIGEGSIVVIEVSDVRYDTSLTSNEPIRKAFNRKKKQGEKTENLVREMLKLLIDSNIDKNPRIHWFCALVNLSRNLSVNFSEKESSRIIWKDSLTHDNLSSWWEENITKTLEVPHPFDWSTMKDLSKILIGLWNIDSHNICDPEQRCDIGNSILKTDKQLKFGEITYSFGRRSSSFKNPNFVLADEVFQKMGIKYLSKEQNEILNSDQKLLWINGLVGSGKSKLMLAKILQIVKDGQQRAAVFKNITNDRTRSKDVYHSVLRDNEVTFDVMKVSIARAMDSKDPTAMAKAQAREISNSLKGPVKVMLVEIEHDRSGPMYKVWRALGGLQVIREVLNSMISTPSCEHIRYFIDDEQCVLEDKNYDWHREVDEILDVSAMNQNCKIWVGSDVAQSKDQYPFKTLSTNFRSTCDISNLLSVIKELERIVSRPKKISLSGHFIHGPRPVFQVFQHRVEDHNLLRQTILEELGIVIDYTSDIGLIYNNTENGKEVMEGLDIAYKIPVCNIFDTFSFEWPAVIFLMDLTDMEHTEIDDHDYAILKQLDIALSRARVYCSAILYSNKRDIANNVDLQDLLAMLKAVANVKLVGFNPNEALSSRSERMADEPSTSAGRPDEPPTSSKRSGEPPASKGIDEPLASKGIDEPSHTSKRTGNVIRTLEDYSGVGKEIKQKYCIKKGRPVMLPPVPKQMFHDIYPDEEDSVLEVEDEDVRRRPQHRESGMKHLQQYIEEEIEVFRVLEMLSGDVLVLQNFSYTHHQYRLCDVKHDKKGCSICKKNAANREGECDFIIIGENYFVIIELKHLGLSKDASFEYLQGAYKRSTKQLSRIRSLLESMMDQMFQGSDEEKISILSFTAFPSINETSLVQNFDEEDKTQMISKEDFSDFNSWWDKNVSSAVPSNISKDYLLKHEAVCDILLAIWCTDKNICDEARCSVVNCILDIHNELKLGPKSKTKKSLPVPGSKDIQAPDGTATAIDVREVNKMDLFRPVFCIQNRKPFEAFSLIPDVNLLLIDGPPGCGRTRTLLEKVLGLIRSGQNVVVFTYNYKGYGTNSVYDLYQRDFEEATLLDAVSEDFADELEQIISGCLQTSKLVIVSMSPKRLGVKLEEVLLQLCDSGRHVFVDDLQAALPRHNLMSDSEVMQNIMDACLRLSANRYVWITSDILQHHDEVNTITIEKYYLHFLDRISPWQRVTLQANQRSTRELAGVVSNIRNQIRDRVFLDEGIVDFVLPQEEPADILIHGPLPLVHVLRKVAYDNAGLIRDILKTELDLLFSEDPDARLRVGILFNDYFVHVDMLEQVQGFNDMIDVCNISEVYSAEYPAVIIVHEFGDYLGDEDQIPQLYLMLSRAKIYCIVILFTREDISEEDDMRLNDFLSSLRALQIYSLIIRDSVKIISH